MNKYNVSIDSVTFMGIFAESEREAARNAVARSNFSDDEINEIDTIVVEDIFLNRYTSFTSAEVIL